MEGQTQDRKTGSVRLPLRVLVLTDGRPGHFNQSKGVLKALAFHRQVQEQWVSVRLKAAAARPVLSALLNVKSWKLGRRMLGWCYELGELPDTAPDLILSAGGNTSFANCWLAREFGSRNLFVGEPRRLRAHCFWRCLTFVAREPSPPFVHWKVTPVPILPEEIQAEGDRYLFSAGLTGGVFWTLLVGGDGGGCQYSENDWKQLCAGLEALARREKIRWLIVTSRRTGSTAERILSMFRGSPWVARLSLYSDDQGKHYRDFLGAGQRIVTTEDSHMMLTESVSTGRPVLCIRPQVAQPDWTGELFLNAYSEAGYIQRARIVDLAHEEFFWTPSRSSFQTPLCELGGLIDGWLRAEGV